MNDREQAWGLLTVDMSLLQAKEMALESITRSGRNLIFRDSLAQNNTKLFGDSRPARRGGRSKYGLAHLTRKCWSVPTS